MIAVRMMQVTVDDIVGVIAMRDGGMTAVGRMDVAGGLFRRAVSGSAGVGIGGTDGNGVFVHVPAMTVMQVAVIKVVGVTVMSDGEMTAAGTVLMLVRLGVFGVSTTADHECQRDNER